MAIQSEFLLDTNGQDLPPGLKEKLWAAADKLRGHMDASEYKHVVLGLIFLKYISDSFEEQRTTIDKEGGDPEDKDEYLAANVFWVPEEARWKSIQSLARSPEIGKKIDEAMTAIEKENSSGNLSLKGVLPKDYARPSLDKTRLGELIDLIGSIELGNTKNRSKDILGRVYEYFLGRFANAEGKGGGEFYTPRSVVELLVRMLEPYRGKVYDPCCGSGGMFVQSEKFIEKHGGHLNDISVYGQESNNTTWKLCKMNLALRGIEANLGPYNADSFHEDLHRDLKADFIMANPPFNISDWGGTRLKSDVRWKYGTPPVNNANYAWIQHIIHHLAPSGYAGFVLANGSMSSSTSGEGEIRKQLIEADLVDCMVALPGQLFFSTQIPACLWFISRNKNNGKYYSENDQLVTYRDRRGETLFIDTRKKGRLIDRVQRELTDEDLTLVADTYHAWRGEQGAGVYQDIPGFCKSVTKEEIISQGYVLTPGRYVGAEETEEDGEVFAEKMARLTTTLNEQFAEGERLELAIKENLRRLGYGS